MSWEIIGLCCVVLLGVLLIIFRKNPYVRKYWKYSLVLLPLVILLILKIINDIRSGSKDPDSHAGREKAKDLHDKIDKIKDEITEVQMETAIEISAARTKNDQVMKDLEEVKKIEDRKERLQKLADMIG